MSWSHVTGSSMFSPAASATDSRYQSNWVLAQNGTEYISPSHMAPSRGPFSVSCVVASATSSGTSARKPASASSGMNGGSMLMRSMDSSPAARRRAICSRCPAAVRGSTEMLMLYAPSDCSAHRRAISAWPPASELMYQVSVGV